MTHCSTHKNGHRNIDLPTIYGPQLALERRVKHPKLEHIIMNQIGLACHTSLIFNGVLYAIGKYQEMIICSFRSPLAHADKIKTN